MAKKSKPKKQRSIPNEDSILLYLHCKQCVEEKPSGVSPKDWSMTQAGWTKLGLQVWCNRHDINVVHIDFEGMQHPANTACSTAKTIQE